MGWPISQWTGRENAAEIAQRGIVTRLSPCRSALIAINQLARRPARAASRWG